MQMLRKKAIILGSSSFIGLGACCYLVYNHSLNLLSILLILITATTVCFYRQLQRLSTASLIMENSILTVPVVTVWSNSDSSSLPKRKKSTLMVVSCFGILSGNEVYKFNCDGIRLLAVEINRESMFLTFGTEEKERHIKLLHGLSNKEDIRLIAEKFRYETGVIPVVAGWHK